MLYSYTYKRHIAEKLHGAVCRFMRRLRFKPSTPGTAFDHLRDCEGELQRRATSSDLLRDLLSEFHSAWWALNEEDKKATYRNFIVTNRIRRLLTGDIRRRTVFELPLPIQDITKRLFIHLYKNSLTKTKKSSHWELFYKRLKVKTCPFCGIETMRHSLLAKQDYDHLLCKASYPFASVNMRNLVPCGIECNRLFKHEQDLIFSDGKQRKAFYPYNDSKCTLQVDLKGSILPTKGGEAGEWCITFLPDQEEVKTWVTVFKLEARYKLDVFSTSYDAWRQEFVELVASQTTAPIEWTPDSIRQKMINYSQTLASNPLHENRFLKASLFAFLLNYTGPAYFEALTKQINNTRKGFR